ncbi:lipocalin-like domain-containing protein [Ferrimonas balearica]|uniref:lipocalin-like domain-containing protein n=1 Tax=Ferrimonas balearica TaxID=44012 RepID=UPI001C9958FB|nr:lipocalin-like domain-containing protein [Ferrimonas balearica]MBY5920386.1 ABC transporter [Ferrimonas balearica]MBY5996929.1 ABC transporter [Ferrimonas balearica]
MERKPGQIGGAAGTGILLAAALMLTGCERQPTPPGFVTSEFGVPVEPGYTLTFPRDHGPHGEYGLEWWYVTANLSDEHGEHHGLQWTLFRFRGPAGTQSFWWDGQGYLAHLMHETEGHHRAWQRAGRAAQVRIEPEPFVAGIDHWWLRSAGTSLQPLHLVASEAGLAIALQLDDSPLVQHGDQGFSDKSGDGKLASYYYSLPRLRVQGYLDPGDGWRKVSGSAWLDREWSSAFLDERFSGWDWMGLQLDDGQNLMVFCLLAAESGQDHCDGSLIQPDGALIALANDVIHWQAEEWVELGDSTYPVKWTLSLPKYGISLKIETRSQDQRNQLDIVYWEGPVKVTGSQDGVGFVEMTGRGSSPR